MSVCLSAQQLLDIFIRYCKAIDFDHPEVTVLTDWSITILREAMTEPYLPLFEKLDPDLKKQCRKLTREQQQQVLSDFRVRILASCRAWEHRRMLDGRVQCTEMSGLKTQKTTSNVGKYNRMYGGGPIRRGEEMAVKQFMLDAYYIDRDQSMENIESQAAALASKSAGKEIFPGRIRTVWGRIVTAIDNGDLTSVRNKHKDDVYCFVKSKACLELFKERDGMQPREIASS
ncbi:MAG: hypothetical protein IH600_05730 [Bacteroidetes bacterium]|nr:hypothetical protein [Bacteroidota bacterium]